MILSEPRCEPADLSSRTHGSRDAAGNPRRPGTFDFGYPALASGAVPNGPEALDLLRKMLAFNPDKRITVEQALAHPFMTSNPNRTPALSEFTLAQAVQAGGRPFDVTFEAIETYEKPQMCARLYDVMVEDQAVLAARRGAPGSQ